MEIKITASKNKEGFKKDGVQFNSIKAPTENFIPLLELMFRQLRNEQMRRAG